MVGDHSNEATKKQPVDGDEKSREAVHAVGQSEVVLQWRQINPHTVPRIHSPHSPWRGPHREIGQDGEEEEAGHPVRDHKVVQPDALQHQVEAPQQQTTGCREKMPGGAGKRTVTKLYSFS